MLVIDSVAGGGVYGIARLVGHYDLRFLQPRSNADPAPSLKTGRVHAQVCYFGGKGALGHNCTPAKLVDLDTFVDIMGNDAAHFGSAPNKL